MKLKYQLSIEIQHGNSTKIYFALIHWHADPYVTVTGACFENIRKLLDKPDWTDVFRIEKNKHLKNPKCIRHPEKKLWEFENVAGQIDPPLVV